MENNKKHIEEANRLKREIEALKLQLVKAEELIDAIRKGSIDALVIPNKKGLKVFTEKTADKLYRTIIEKMHEGAVMLNKDGTILYCNSCFSNMVNLPLQKIIGSKFKNFIENASKGRFKKLLEQSWENTINAIKGDFDLQTTDGEHTPVLISLNTLPVDKAFVTSIIITDLTIIRQNQEELKKLNETLESKVIQRTRELELAYNRLQELNYELEENNKAKNKFISIISHDLNNPASAIISSSEMMMDDAEALQVDEIKNIARIINNSSHKMVEQLSQLVKWSKQKNKKINFNPQTKNLHEFLIFSLELLQSNAFQKKITIINQIDKNLKVYADPLLLRSIFQNLITNSIKFTPEGGQIIIDAYQKNGSFIEISIEDNGVGIPEEVKTKLFSDESVMKDAEIDQPSGLGLILVKDFVEKHKGKIRVESESGKGSIFYFTLPMQ